MTLCTSACVPRCQQRFPWLGEATLQQEGSVQAGQDRMSFPRRGCFQQGKALSQPVKGVALTACAAHGVLSAQELELSLCSGWLSRQGWCLWILGVNKEGGIAVGGRVRAEAAPSQAIKAFSELLCCKTHPACLCCSKGSPRGPKTSSGVWFCSSALLLCFSNHSSAVPAPFGAALTTELLAHHNKRFPVLQVNLFPSCLQRQLEQALGHKAQAELAVPQRMGRMCLHLPGEGEQGGHLQWGCVPAPPSDVSFP